jgi:HAD superfamily phosphatase
MSGRMLVFDIDGVLVDVSESYRATIVRTVADFTGREVTADKIQDYKNQGGWNDDWELSHKLIADFGVEVAFERVVEHFNKLFLGNGSDGMILRERWIAAPGLMERLASRYRLAIFSGRRMYEVEPTLARFAAGLRFDPIVTAELTPRLKPAPDGLNLILETNPDARLTYIGDAIDDGRAAKAAGVPFIGVASMASPRRDDLVRLFREEGAAAVVEDINQLESVL